MNLCETELPKDWRKRHIVARYILRRAADYLAKACYGADAAQAAAKLYILRTDIYFEPETKKAEASHAL